MRENMPKTMIQSLLQSFGGGGTVGSAGGKEASQLDRSPEVRKASNLKILGYYGASSLRSILRILCNLNASDGTATFPFSLWVREQLCEQSELTTAGEGLIRSKEAKRSGCQASIINKFLNNLAKLSLNENSLPSCPPGFYSSDFTHPFTSPPLKGGEKESSPLPSPIGEGTVCHCEEGVCPTSQSQNSCNIMGLLRKLRLLVMTLSSRFTLHSSLKKRAAFTLAEGAMHVALPTSQRKSAFTLAEVLITLGIIGVVAAITMPALMANYQKMVQRQQFKKAYNTVYNAFRLAETNLGYHPMCYYGDDNKGGECLEYDDKGECIKWGNFIVNNTQRSDCDVFKNQLKSTLKIIKICEGNGVADGCIPEYNGNDKIYTDNNPDATEQEITTGTTGESGWRTNNIRTKSHVWVLSDGVILLWYSDWIMYFAIDINGKKGPNKWGYDLFPFQLKSNLDKPLYLTPVNRVEKGGVSSQQMLKDIGR